MPDYATTLPFCIRSTLGSSVPLFGVFTILCCCGALCFVDNVRKGHCLGHLPLVHQPGQLNHYLSVGQLQVNLWPFTVSSSWAWSRCPSQKDASHAQPNMLHVVQVDSRLPIIRGAEDMAYEKSKADKSPFAKFVVPPDALSGDLLAPYGNCVYSL